MRGFTFTCTLPPIFQRCYKALLYKDKKVANSKEPLSDIFHRKPVAETTSGSSIFILHDFPTGLHPEMFQLATPPVCPGRAM